MSGMRTELEGLFVDESEEAIDTLIRTTLEPLLGLTRNGKIVTKAPFLKLAIPARILAVMLAHLALSRLKVATATVEVTAEQLESECMATVKACRECLSRLKGKHLLAKNDTGYFIPIWAVSKVVTEISGNS